jgi:membrane-bound ClpP family serine protease
VNLPNFSPTVDLPLAALIYASALLATVVWLRRVRSKSDLLIEVTETRIATRILVVVLLLLIPCYLIDIAFWGVAALIMALFIFGLLVGGEPGGIIAGPVLIAGLFVREFVLGFPEFILKPEPAPQIANHETINDPLVGQRAVTDSALRPTGVILRGGCVLQAASDDGTFIDANVAVTILSFRNGIYLVAKIADEPSDH